MMPTYESDNDITRWLNPAAALALTRYAEQEGLSQAEVKQLYMITGRGYRPAETVEGWKEFHTWVKGVMTDGNG